jgi:hypothetical protein
MNKIFDINIKSRKYATIVRYVLLSLDQHSANPLLTAAGMLKKVMHDVKRKTILNFLVICLFNVYKG